MDAILQATVVPKLPNYAIPIDFAHPHALAVAAFNAGYISDTGFTGAITAAIRDGDDTAIGLIETDQAALDAVRDAARAGAAFLTTGTDSPFICDPSERGGSDIWIVGGFDTATDPFPEFRAVAVLAALLTRPVAC